MLTKMFQNGDTSELDDLRRDLNNAVAAKFGPRLEPGETLLVDIQCDKKVMSVHVTIEKADHSDLFELEAARLDMDQEGKFEGTDEEALTDLIDFVDVSLEDYFNNERFIHFNDDWRKTDYFDHVLRYRAVLRRPKLDELADAWINAGGDPDKVAKEEGALDSLSQQNYENKDA